LSYVSIFFRIAAISRLFAAATVQCNRAGAVPDRRTSPGEFPVETD